MVKYFEYGETEINYLKRADEKMAYAIEVIGPIKRQVETDLFEALINSIIGQLISAKAHKTIWTRMRSEYENFTPEAINNTSAEDLKRHGISLRKANYIKEIALACLNDKLDLQSLHTMSDEKVCNTLTKLKGVGQWTAEMFLIFSLQRPDVVSFGDLGIRRGMSILYGINELDFSTFNEIRQNYSPYGSVASLYLWEISGSKMHFIKE